MRLVPAQPPGPVPTHAYTRRGPGRWRWAEPGPRVTGHLWVSTGTAQQARACTLAVPFLEGRSHGGPVVAWPCSGQLPVCRLQTSVAAWMPDSLLTCGKGPGLLGCAGPFFFFFFFGPKCLFLRERGRGGAEREGDEDLKQALR